MFCLRRVDNGSQFTGNVFKALVDRYKVQKVWFNARYHPQVNFVERNNRTIGTAIGCYIDGNHKTWDKKLPKIRSAINTAKHEITGYSLSYLNFGRHVPLCGSYYGKIPGDKDFEIMPGDRDQYAVEIDFLSDVFLRVWKNLHQSYQRNASRYNLRRREVTFKTGDKVWCRNFVLSDKSKGFSAKLAPKYVICKVKEKLG